MWSANSSSEKIFLLELKKIFFYSFDAENSYLSNGAKIRTIRAKWPLWPGVTCLTPMILPTKEFYTIRSSYGPTERKGLRLVAWIIVAWYTSVSACGMKYKIGSSCGMYFGRNPTATCSRKSHYRKAFMTRWGYVKTDFLLAKTVQKVVSVVSMFLFFSPAARLSLKSGYF